MGLVGAVVGILAEDYAFHGVQGCVSRPWCFISLIIRREKTGCAIVESYQEYTSAAGGKIFFPLSCSLFRKRFRSRKSLVTTSSFSWDSQLSSSDAISKASRSFCSGVSFSTHFALSNFGMDAADAAGEGAAAVEVKMDAAVVAVVDALDL